MTTILPFRPICTLCGHPLESADDARSHNQTSCLAKRELTPPYILHANLPQYPRSRMAIAQPEVLRDA